MYSCIVSVYIIYINCTISLDYTELCHYYMSGIVWTEIDPTYENLLMSKRPLLKMTPWHLDQGQC